MLRGGPRRFLPPLGPPRPNAKQDILAQWRGVDLTPLEKERAPSTRKVESIMQNVARELRLDRRCAEAEIARVWNHLVDPDVVKHAQPTGIHKGTLFVRVDSSVWLEEIVRYRRKEILKRLQHSFGPEMIQKISFRVG